MKKYIIKNADGSEQSEMQAIHESRKEAGETLMDYICDHNEDLDVDDDDYLSPFDFSMFCKMNRAFFADKNVNMTLVSACKNFTATVNNAIERSIKENGDRTDNFAQMVNSNLPGSFTLSIPVFKGGDKENLEVETFAKIDGRNVAFVLMSPGAEETLETLRDTAIDKELEAIKEIAPEIAIIEI